MSTTHIPFLDVPAAYAELRDELDAAARAVMASGAYILGPEVTAFEEEFAAYCETRHAIGVASGLDALRLILEGYGVGAGDEVLVPSNTFIATWLAVSQAGATPVPVEPDEGTHNVTAAAVEARSRRRPGRSSRCTCTASPPTWRAWRRWGASEASQ